MRLLSDEEMDAIFGGDDKAVQTLDSVTVTAPRLRETLGFYLPGVSSFIREETTCGWCYSYYASIYRAVPADQVPSLDRARCLADATAQTGKGFRTDYQLNIVPSQVYRDPTLDLDVTDWVHRGGQGVTSSGVSGYTQEAAGLTLNANNGTGVTYLYAGAMRPGHVPGSYIDPVTQQQGTLSGPLTLAENLVFTLGHELYHQYYNKWTILYDQVEARAHGWGASAVEKFREGAGANCPST